MTREEYLAVAKRIDLLIYNAPQSYCDGRKTISIFYDGRCAIEDLSTSDVVVCGVDGSILHRIPGSLMRAAAFLRGSPYVLCACGRPAQGIVATAGGYDVSCTSCMESQR
jgi:hypothetical protein